MEIPRARLFMTALPKIKDNDNWVWLTMDSIVSSRVHFRCQYRSNRQPTLPTVLQTSLNPGSYVSHTFIIETRFLFYSGVSGSFFHTRTTLELDFYVKMTIGNSLNVRQVQPAYTCMEVINGCFAFWDLQVSIKHWTFFIVYFLSY